MTSNAFRTRNTGLGLLLISLGLSPCLASADEASSDKPAATLEEVVVTAQKKDETLKDVPIPISVVDTQALQDNNQVRLQDWATQVPNLTISPGNQSTTQITIRGINTTQIPGSIPTVGLAVDDVPFGSSLILFVPDLDPGDLRQIEVLRGPQGTLYGTSSMGGLIRYVTLDPSTSGITGRVQAGTSDVDHAGSVGYTFRGSINVPLGSDFAFRLSAFTREDPGYIDNVLLGTKDVNETRGSGGHLVALWTPSDTFSVRLTALYQELKGNGLDYEIAGPGQPGQFEQQYVAGVGPYQRESQNYGLKISDQAGPVNITSVTGYSVYSFDDSLDASFLGGISGALFTTPAGAGASGVPGFEHYVNSRLTEELRFSGSIGKRLDWLVAGFYDHERVSPGLQSLLAEDPVTGALGVCKPLAFTFNPACQTGVMETAAYGYHYNEYAVFADLTVHITERFNVQFGSRGSRISEGQDQLTETGMLPHFTCAFPEANNVCIIPRSNTTTNPVTYLLSPQFKASEDVMLYARFASGYRPGGNNIGVLQQDVPSAYDPDKVYNYELGLKSDLLQHRLSIDTSIYYIDWQDMQFSAVSPQSKTSYTGNVGTAKSEGIEFQVQGKPLPGLELSSWVTWSEAQMTSNVPPAQLQGTYALSGTQLPLSPRWSGNVSANWDFPLTGEWSGSVGAVESYVGARAGGFPSENGNPPSPPVIPPLHLAPYAQTDLRAGLKYGTWDANLYANNVTNRRGVLASGLSGGAVAAGYYAYIIPRTVGLTITKSF